MRRTVSLALVLAVLIAPLAMPLGDGAVAQQIKRPYDFNRSGLGMSTAYKQALLNAEINGVRPDNLVRGAGGGLANVTEGPDGVALIRDGGAQFVPGRRTSGLRLAVGDIGVRFSVGGSGGGSGGVALAPTGPSTVGHWTDLVHGMVPGGGGEVSQWVAQAHALPPRRH